MSRKDFNYYKKILEVDFMPMSELLTEDSKKYMDEETRKQLIRNGIEAQLAKLPPLKLERSRANHNHKDKNEKKDSK